MTFPPLALALASTHFATYLDRPTQSWAGLDPIPAAELEAMERAGLVEVYTQDAEQDQNGWYHELAEPVRRAGLTWAGRQAVHPEPRCPE